MINLEDHRQSWQMRSDGTYALRDASQLAEDDSRMEGTHARLMGLTRERTDSDG
jgi:hypothetical protein